LSVRSGLMLCRAVAMPRGTAAPEERQTMESTTGSGIRQRGGSGGGRSPWAGGEPGPAGSRLMPAAPGTRRIVNSNVAAARRRRRKPRRAICRRRKGRLHYVPAWYRSVRPRSVADTGSSPRALSMHQLPRSRRH